MSLGGTGFRQKQWTHQSCHENYYVHNIFKTNLKCQIITNSKMGTPLTLLFCPLVITNNNFPYKWNLLRKCCGCNIYLVVIPTLNPTRSCV